MKYFQNDVNLWDGIMNQNSAQQGRESYILERKTEKKKQVDFCFFFFFSLISQADAGVELRGSVLRYFQHVWLGNHF